MRADVWAAGVFCLSPSGMMRSQKVFRGLVMQPVDHNLMREPHTELTISLLVNTHLSTGVEQQWEGGCILHRTSLQPWHRKRIQPIFTRFISQGYFLSLIRLGQQQNCDWQLTPKQRLSTLKKPVKSLVQFYLDLKRQLCLFCIVDSKSY